jgi:hypothetical protein
MSLTYERLLKANKKSALYVRQLKITALDPHSLQFIAGFRRIISCWAVAFTREYRALSTAHIDWWADIIGSEGLA